MFKYSSHFPLIGSISSHNGTEVPSLPTTIPAQIFAKIQESKRDNPFDSPKATAESTVSPAPVTSYTFRAMAGRWIIRSPLLNKQYGEGFANEKPRDEIDKKVLQNKPEKNKWGEQNNSDRAFYETGG